MFIETNMQRIFWLFCRYPTTKFTIRELAKRAKVVPATAASVVRKLEKDGFVQLGTVGKAAQVQAAIENEKFRELKRILNIYSLLEIKNALTEFYNYPDAIIAYGSYAKGEDIERSDIDIAVISKLKKEFDAKPFEKKMGREIHIMRFDDWKEAPENLKGSIINGTKLYGTIDVM